MARTLTAMLLLFCACATPRIPPEELVIVVAERPNRISEVDGRRYRRRTVELPPGSHSFEFSGEFGKFFKGMPTVGGSGNSPKPLINTRCFVSVESMKPGRYFYTANDLVEEHVAGPDGSSGWTKTSTAPRLVDADGLDVSGMKCDETCRLQGRKDRENVLSTPCKERDMSLLDNKRGGVDPVTGELFGDYLDRLMVECKSRGFHDDQELSRCMTLLAQNPIAFKLATGEVHRFVPAADVSTQQGDREEARIACVRHSSAETLARCLLGYGWIPLR